MATPAPQITPGSNGYEAMLPVPTMGTNPWTVSDTSAQVTQGQKALQGMTTQSNQYAAQSAAYPTFQNSMGLGSQTAFPATPAAEGPALQTNVMGPQQPSLPAPAYNQGSSGFNPWSLSGEALST